MTYLVKLSTRHWRSDLPCETTGTGDLSLFSGKFPWWRVLGGVGGPVSPGILGGLKGGFGGNVFRFSVGRGSGKGALLWSSMVSGDSPGSGNRGRFSNVLESTLESSSSESITEYEPRHEISNSVTFWQV